MLSRRSKNWFRLPRRFRNKTDLRKSAQTDDLVDTVDYVHLNKIVVEEMAIRSKLLEHVAQRIIVRTFQKFHLFLE